MPADVEWKNTNPIIHYGEVVNYEIISTICDRMVRHDLFEQMKYQIHDFTKTKKSILNSFEIDVISARDIYINTWNEGLYVILACNTKEMTEHALLYKEFMQELAWKVNIVDTIEEAYALAEEYEAVYAKQ